MSVNVDDSENSIGVYPLYELQQDKEELIHEFKEISKTLELLDSNLNDILIQKPRKKSQKHVSLWDITNDFDEHMFKGEYVKAYESLKKEINVYKTQKVTPLYLFRKYDSFKTYLLKLKEDISLELGFITKEIGLRHMEEGNFDEAINSLLESINIWNFQSILPYHYLAKSYHYKKEFKLEHDVLKEAVDRMGTGFYLECPSGLANHMIFYLENVTYYLEFGKFKKDYFPTDPKSIIKKIKQAKKLLKNGDANEGIKLLEKIVKKGTYTNTVYFTLYKKYIEFGKWDCAIKICDKAIEEMGVFSQDRIKKYTEYKNRVIKLSKN